MPFLCTLVRVCRHSSQIGPSDFMSTRPQSGHCCNRYDLGYVFGLLVQHNPDDFRGGRFVVAAVFWAVLGEEFIQHVLTEMRRAQYASVGEGSLHKECEPDQMIQ